MDIYSDAFFALWAALAHLYAYSKGYFRLPAYTSLEKNGVDGRLCATAFLIYFITSSLLGPWIAKGLLHLLHYFDPTITTLSLRALCGLQVALMLFILVLLLILIRKQMGTIWKSNQHSSLSWSFLLGASTWFLAFPLASFLGDLSDWILNHYFGVSSYEQTAVSFLKSAMAQPATLLLALLAVLILAPILEELLFRGILQSYLKNKVGRKAAILLSALIFALFHFSPSQGLGNISLALSLFTLGIYLGFLYERQGSLAASIGLHCTFNAVSSLRILLFPEST